jgi:hypothetical protein
MGDTSNNTSIPLAETINRSMMMRKSHFTLTDWLRAVQVATIAWTVTLDNGHSLRFLKSRRFGNTFYFLHEVAGWSKKSYSVVPRDRANRRPLVNNTPQSNQQKQKKTCDNWKQTNISKSILQAQRSTFCVHGVVLLAKHRDNFTFFFFYLNKLVEEWIALMTIWEQLNLTAILWIPLVAPEIYKSKIFKQAATASFCVCFTWWCTAIVLFNVT